MTREDDLRHHRQEAAKLEEALQANRKHYRDAEEQEAFFADLARDTTALYDGLLARYRGSSFRTGLSRDWEGVHEEQTQHQRGLRQELEALDEAYQSLTQQEEANRTQLRALERSDTDER